MFFFCSLDMGAFEDQTEKSVTVQTGHAAVLELPPIESYPPPLVMWQVDDGNTIFGRKFFVTTSHQLVVLACSKDDQKAYRYSAHGSLVFNPSSPAQISLHLSLYINNLSLFLLLIKLHIFRLLRLALPTAAFNFRFFIFNDT